jgi:hypothetical protein
MSTEPNSRVYAKPIQAIPAKDRRDHSPIAGRPSTYRVPAGFDRVDGIKCASPDCGIRVHFVHRRTRFCLACATKAGIVLGWEPGADLRGAEPNATDESVVERIAIARRLRESTHPDESILPLLERAMEGSRKSRNDTPISAIPDASP